MNDVLVIKKAIATNNRISVSPRKLALVTRMIAEKSVVDAMNMLTLCKKGCAKDVSSLLNSAVKNAINNFGVDDVTNLCISEIRLGRGVKAKRMMPRARGRSNRIIKHFSTLSVIVCCR